MNTKGGWIPAAVRGRLPLAAAWHVHCEPLKNTWTQRHDVPDVVVRLRRRFHFFACSLQTLKDVGRVRFIEMINIFDGSLSGNPMEEESHKNRWNDSPSTGRQAKRALTFSKQNPLNMFLCRALCFQAGFLQPDTSILKLFWKIQRWSECMILSLKSQNCSKCPARRSSCALSQ